MSKFKRWGGKFMNRKNKAKLMLLYTLLFSNANSAHAENTDAKNSNNTNISENSAKTKTSDNSKKNKPKSPFKPRPTTDIRQNGTQKQVEQQPDDLKLRYISNAIGILIACVFVFSLLYIIPWTWDKAFQFIKDNNLFRNDNYNDTTKIITMLLNSDYKKFGVEYKGNGEDDDNKIDFVNLGKDLLKDGIYNVELSNSKYHCIFLEPKFVDSSQMKIKIKPKKPDQNVTVVAPVHVEVEVDSSDNALDILRISSPSLCLGYDNVTNLDDVKKAWWQDKNIVKDLYLDTDKNQIYYKISKSESIHRKDFLNWIENHKNTGTTIEKLSFGPIYIKNS